MDLMRIILGLDKEVNKKSNYLIALESARRLTGRNLLDGTAKCINDMRCNLLDIDKLYHSNEQIMEDQPVDEKMMIGLTMYLILLDLIGCLFKRNDKSVDCRNCTNGIKIALVLFSNLENEEIKAICDLRNSLAHNFGLATERRTDKKRKEKKEHKFTLSFTNDDPIIKLPTKEWNNKYGDTEDDSSSTVIGVYAFCNEVENIVKELIKVYRAGNLEFRLSEEEIRSRFTIRV